MKHSKRRPEEAECTQCHHVFEPTLHRGWHISAGAAGLVLGALMTESFLGGLVIGGLSYAGARAADRYYSLRCPSCGGRATWIREQAPEKRKEEEVEVTEEARPAA